MKKKLAAVFLSCALMLSLIAPASAQETFSDVKSTDWYYDYVMELYKRGVINGVGDGKFNPNGTVTAEEFFALGARLVVPWYINSDAASEHWSYPYYDALLKARIIDDYWWARTTDGYKRLPSSKEIQGVKSKMRRYEMALLLYEMAEYRRENMSVLPNIENNLKDSAQCTRQILWAYSAGIVTGKSGNVFDPSGYMTRAEMCTVFCRLMRFVPRAEVVVQEEPESEYFMTSGVGKGRLKLDVARDLGLQTLSTLTVAEDQKGVYVSVAAPVLPAELQNCYMRIVPIVERPNGDYFVDSCDMELKSGESAKVYLNSFSDTPVRASQIGSMRIYVEARVPDFGETVTYRTDTSTNKYVIEELYTDVSRRIELDVSHVFVGIEK